MKRFCLFLLRFLCLCVFTWGRRHTLRLKNDFRRAALCSNFGFFKGGHLSLSVEQLDGKLQNIFFSLDKSGNSGVASVLEAKPSDCFRGEDYGFLYLSFDPLQKLVHVHNKDLSLRNLIFEYSAEDIDGDGPGNTAQPASRVKAIHSALNALHLEPQNVFNLSTQIDHLIKPVQNFDIPESLNNQSSVFKLLHRLAEISLPSEVLINAKLWVERQETAVDERQLPTLGSTTLNLSDSLMAALETVYKYTNVFGSLRAIPYETNQDTVNVRFTIRFPDSTEEGLYSLYIHNCPLSDEKLSKRPPMNVTLKMVEKNPDSYLSAGQQPLPLLYSILCCLYFFASLLWFMFLRISKKSKFRMHYLMFVVVLTKSISLAFHGINYYVIGKHGVAEEGWAVMYYITHIIRGALLFITILLIGAGWAFIKRMLTSRERSLFLIVIPLQILANVASVVIEESETGMTRYALWKDIFIFVDLACCGAILFPVVWSMRHLQAASQIDGKAAVNLRNLRLFRHFYVSVICYVYFTRVIAYLLAITVVYWLTWVIELFKESVTFVFFVVVGYTFRPVDDNPYLLVSTDDDEEDTIMERIQLEDVWSQSGVSDGVTRLTRARSDQQEANHLTEGRTNPAFVGRSAADGQLDPAIHGNAVP